MDIPTLHEALRRIETLITREAESYADPEERLAEFTQRLERTRRLMEYLGDPQQAFDTIHIGGTSGKGSVAMLCEAMLLAGGLRTGTHTSPYLQTPLEKVRVNGALIRGDEVPALIDRVMAAIARLQADHPALGRPHYAEAWLGLALRHFADRGCRIGVVEVGMGGRYDATNVLTPRVSVISTVHYDHVRVLGDTLGEIAYHKAGIIKPGVPAVVGDLPPEAMAVIADEASRCGARLVRIGREVTYQPISLSDRGGRLSYHGPALRLEDLEVGLLGAHQLGNAALALAALEVYAEAEGLALDEAGLRRGLADVRFAGRIEMMQREPAVILDGAHNEEKIGALVAALQTIFHYRRLILVLGMLETKTATPIVQRLAGLADTVITTAPHVRGKPAIQAGELAALVRQAGVPEVIAEGSPAEALAHALRMAAPDDLIVCTGSLYLIGELRSHWHDEAAIVARQTTFPNHGAGTD